MKKQQHKQKSLKRGSTLYANRGAIDARSNQVLDMKFGSASKTRSQHFSRPLKQQNSLPVGRQDAA